MNARTRFSLLTDQLARIAVIVAGVLASNVASALPPNVTWQGSNNGLWTTGTNWNPNTAPTTNSSVFFGATGGATSRFNNSVSLTNLNFDAATKSFTIVSSSSAVLTVSNVSNNSNFAQQIGVGATLAGGTIGGSGNIGFGNIGGSGNVSKSGTGQLTISSGNYSGTLTVDNGSLLVTGDIGSANVVVNPGASLITTANNPTTFNNIDVQGGLFSPGGTPGIGSVVVNNSLTLGPNSVSNFDIISTTENDKVSSASLNYDGGLNITFSDTTSVVFNMFIPTGIPAAPSNTYWNLFTSDTAPTGNFDSVSLTIGNSNYNFTSLGNGLWRTLGDIGLGSDPQGGYYGFLFAEHDTLYTYANGQANLTAGAIYAVPEPSTIVFAGIGMAMFGWSTWTRRRAQVRRKMIEASIA